VLDRWELPDLRGQGGATPTSSLAAVSASSAVSEPERLPAVETGLKSRRVAGAVMVVCGVSGGVALAIGSGDRGGVTFNADVCALTRAHFAGSRQFEMWAESKCFRAVRGAGSESAAGTVESGFRRVLLVIRGWGRAPRLLCYWDSRRCLGVISGRIDPGRTVVGCV